MPIMSHVKMLDDGTILFSANCVYAYIRTNYNICSFRLICSLVPYLLTHPFELYPRISNPKSAPVSMWYAQ